MYSAGDGRGFTLVELVTVLVITGVLALVAAPRFFDLGNFQARLDQEEVRSALALARRLAMARACEVRLVFEAGGYRIERRSRLEDCGSWQPGGGYDPFEPELERELSTPPATELIIFNGQGQAHSVGTADPIVLTLAGQTLLIERQTGFVHGG